MKTSRRQGMIDFFLFFFLEEIMVDLSLLVTGG